VKTLLTIWWEKNENVQKIEAIFSESLKKSQPK